MRDVNDDMDELFKKAAEHYPLNTNSGDWNEVKKALQPASGTLKPAPQKNKSRRFLWLLLLIPFIVVLEKYIFNPVHKNMPFRAAPVKVNNSLSDQNIGGSNPKNQTSANTLKNTPGILSPATSNIASRAQNNILLKKNIQHTKSLRAQDITLRSYAPKPTYPSRPLSNAATENSSEGYLKSNYKNTVNTQADFNEEDTAKTEALLINSGLTNNVALKKQITPLQSEKKDSPVTGTALTYSTGTLKKNITKKGSKANNRQHFFIGLAAGPDITTIKLQKIIKTGFNAGVITGYALNKRWSIETGVYLDKKFYYTEGKYFNTKKIPLPATIQILNAKGSCKMIEVPLNVKYNFIVKQKANWFAAAGISSYFVKKENYGYLLTAYGQTPWEHEYSYKNSSKNWASILNLSMGYTHRIGKNGTLRIAPYVKVPVKGIGIGSLPVTSSGIDFGFTKNLF